MAQTTIPLIHGFITGKGTEDETRHMSIVLRELGSKDIVDAQLESERVVISPNGKAVAYCSEVLMGLELLRRQIASVGDMPGPLSLKQIYQFHPEDLKLLTERADAVDGLLVETATRGRSAAAGDGAQ